MTDPTDQTERADRGEWRDDADEGDRDDQRPDLQTDATVAEPGHPELDPAPDLPGAVVVTASAERPASADPRVDDALSRLGEVDSLPLGEQVEVFTDIHRRLAAVLADPDSRA